MTSEFLDAWFVLIPVWFGTAVLLVFRRPYCGDQVAVLKKRLRAYAIMHDSREETAQPSSAAGLELPPQDHAILLGVLKKVEGKNATMVGIWAFLFSALVAGLSFSDDLAFQQTSAVLLLSSLPFLMAAIRGTRQLDNFSRAVKLHVDDECFARELQKDLMHDALAKECYFDFSRTGAGLFTFLLVLLACIYFFG